MVPSFIRPLSKTCVAAWPPCDRLLLLFMPAAVTPIIDVDCGQAYGSRASPKLRYQYFTESLDIQGHAGEAGSSITFLADMHSGRSAAVKHNRK